MSYDIKLSGDCNHQIVEEDQILETDQITTVLDATVSGGTPTVRINDFARNPSFRSERPKREIITSLESDSKTFYVSNPPMYDGLKVGNLTTSTNDVIIKKKVENEDESSQISGIEDFFIVSNTPILRANRYDFTTQVEEGDLDLTIKNSSGTDITDTFEIVDIDARNGKVQLDKAIPLGSSIRITYYYQDTINEFDAELGKIVLDRQPKMYRVQDETVTQTDGVYTLAHSPVMNGTYEVYQNGTLLTDVEEYQLDLETGELDFRIVLASSDVITATYTYGFLMILYYENYQDGWYLNPSQKSLQDEARDVVFYQPKNTDRLYVSREDVSSQFSEEVTAQIQFTSTRGGERRFQMKHTYIVDSSYTVYVNGAALVDGTDYSLNIVTGILTLVQGLTIGDILRATYSYRTVTRRSFVVANTPLLPLFQNFYSTPDDTLNNAVLVYRVHNVINETIVRLQDQYQLRQTPVLVGSYSIYKGGLLLQEGRDYTFNRSTGIIIFQVTIRNADVLTATYQYGERLQVSSVDPETGTVRLLDWPRVYDVIEVNYYYQSSIIVLDRITVDYYVRSTYCLKCLTNNPIIDYKLDGLGNYIEVRNEDKLVQDLHKIIQTIRGSDPVATWYGTLLEEIIGTQLFPEYVITRISGDIVEALTRLKNAQIQQEEYQEVTDREFLDLIESLDVEQDISDPTYYKAFIKVVTQAGNSFEIEQPLQITSQSQS